MRRSFRTITRFTLTALGTLATLAGSRTDSAKADAVNYVGQRRLIRACILVSDAAQDGAGTNALPSNPIPHVFYALNRRSDIKPAGWEFINPLASQTITNDIRTRWQNRNSNGSGSDRAFLAGTQENIVFQVGAPLTKNIGAYWEVNLDRVSITDLQQFDIVLMPMHGGRQAVTGAPIVFTTDEREKLRRYADGGGTIWLENDGVVNPIGNGASQQGEFIFDVNLSASTVPNAGYLAQTGHPIISSPYSLSPLDVTGLGVSGGARNPFVTGISSLVSPSQLTAIAVSGNFPTIYAGDYGAGHILLTTPNIAGDVNNFLVSYQSGAQYGSSKVVDNNGSNDGAVSGESLSGTPEVDVKFAMNVVAWISAVPTPGGNVRRTGSTTESIGSQLYPKWAQLPAPSVGNVGSGATIYKGASFFVDGNNVFHVFNNNPGRTLNNNNDLDTGLADFVLGRPYDEIANVTLGGDPTKVRYSTPSVFSVNNGGAATDVAVVTSTQGLTSAYDVTPIFNGNGFRQSTLPVIFSGFGLPGNTAGDLTGALSQTSNFVPYAKPVPAPAYSGGILFTIAYEETVTGRPGWRIVPIDLLASVSSKSAVDVFGANVAAPGTGSYTGGQIEGIKDPVGDVAVASIHDEATGAIDRVVYVPFDRNTGTPPAPGGVRGLWFSTTGEPMDADRGNPTFRFHPRGARGNVPWYAPTAGGAGSLFPVVHTTITDANGVVTSLNDLKFPADFSVTYEGNATPHEIFINLTTPITAPFGSKLTVTADWTADWSDTDIKGQTPTIEEMELFVMRRRNFNLYTPDINTMVPFLAGGVAISSADAAQFTASGLLTFNPNSTTRPGSDRIYSVHEQYTAGMVPAAGNNMRVNGTQVQWMFSPFEGGTYTDGVTTVTMRPRLVYQPFNSGIVGSQTLYNFNAIGTPVISNGTTYVVGTASFNANGSATPDATVILALSTTIDATLHYGSPLPYDPVNPTVILYQPDVEHVQGSTQRVELTVGKNFEVDYTTGDIHIFDMKQDGRDSFNTALPIMVQPIPVGGGALPPHTIMVNPSTGFGPLDNLQWFMAIPYNADLTDPTKILPASALQIVPTSGASVLGSTLYFNATGGRIVSVDLKGALDGKVFTPSGTPRVHVQYTLTDTTTGNPLNPINVSINPPLGTANTLVSANAQGLAGFDNGLIIVADNNRLIEIDAGGNPVWSLPESTSLSSVGGPTIATGGVSATKVPFLRPSVARRANVSEYLVADAGNNRIVQTDRSGSVRYELHSVNNTMGFLRPGDPLTLNAPTDVQTYIDARDGNGKISIYNRDTKVTYTYNGAYYAIHYVIADSGNFRAMEVVDAYDNANNPITVTGSDGSSVTMQRQVVFVTRSLAEQNAHYRYRTVEQFVDPASQITYMIASVNNVRQAPYDAGVANTFGGDKSSQIGPGGSLMIIERYTANDGNVTALVNSIAFYDSKGGFVRYQALSNPTMFKKFDAYNPITNQPELRYLMADANGCYVLKTSGSDLVVEWALTSEDYKHLTGRPLRPTSIQRLTQADLYTDGNNVKRFAPHFLITNAYTGPDDIGSRFLAGGNGEVHGEVFEIKGKDYYFSTATDGTYNGYRNAQFQLYFKDMNGLLASNMPFSSITRMIPNEKLPTNTPVKRSLGSDENGKTYNLEQPSFSDRPL